MNRDFQFRDKIRVQTRVEDSELSKRLEQHPWFEIDSQDAPQLVFVSRVPESLSPNLAVISLSAGMGQLIVPDINGKEIAQGAVRCPHPVSAALATLLKPLQDALRLKRVIATVLLSTATSAAPLSSLELLDNVVPSAPTDEARVAAELIELLPSLRGHLILRFLRVPMSSGFIVSVVADLEKDCPLDNICHLWQTFEGCDLPSPSIRKQPIELFSESSYPQPRLHSHQVSVGQLHSGDQGGLSFVVTGPSMAHHAIAIAELMVTSGLVFW